MLSRTISRHVHALTHHQIDAGADEHAIAARAINQVGRSLIDRKGLLWRCQNTDDPPDARILHGLSLRSGTAGRYLLGCQTMTMLTPLSSLSVPVVRSSSARAVR